MKNLKHNSLLLVGDEDMKLYFKNYFEDILLVKDNSQALLVQNRERFPIIFLSDDIDTAKKIRMNNRETIIAIIAHKIAKKNLLEAIPLHLSGLMELPLRESEVEKSLENIDSELEYLYPNIFWLKNGYSFDINQDILYDNYHHKVKLTKKEKLLLKILIQSKNQFISSETIEYTIWEEDSLNKDCRGRLKALINGIRKKLPKGSIINNYSIGYKIVKR